MNDRDANENVDVKPSDIEGLGVFACKNFHAGDYIDSVEYEREVTSDAPLNPEQGERSEHCTYPDGKVMLVAFPGRHMNHSCDPNAYYKYDGTASSAYARRRILAGEEVTVDYLVNNPGGDSWRCLCGSPRCRGETGTGYFELPLEIQKEYYPLLAPWFKERFQEEVADLESLI